MINASDFLKWLLIFGVPYGNPGSGDVTSVQGTLDQILVNGSVDVPQHGALVLTLPQSIDPTSSPSFAAMSLDGHAITLGSDLDATGIVYSSSLGVLATDAANFSWNDSTQIFSVNGNSNFLQETFFGGTGESSFSATGYLTLGTPLASVSGGTGLNNSGLTINLSNGALNYVMGSDSSGNATWQNIQNLGNHAVSVTASTTVNLAATYNNGAAGVGATLTATSNGVYAPDGVTIQIGNRILFNNQTSPFQNGVYDTVSPGTVSTPASFVRSSNFNTPALMDAGQLIYVNHGAVNLARSYVQNSVVTTVGTDNLNFAIANYNSQLVALLSAVGGTLSTSQGGLASPFFIFSGATTAAKTYTLPNASCNILTDNILISLAQGGTNANLTAVNLGIVYSTASAFAISAAPSTANLLLISGATAPGWLATANSSLLYTNASGVPAFVTTLAAPSTGFTLTCNSTSSSVFGGTPATWRLQNINNTATNWTNIEWLSQAGTLSAAICVQNQDQTNGYADLAVYTRSSAGITEKIRFTSAGPIKFTDSSNFIANGSTLVSLTAVAPTGTTSTVGKWLTLLDNTGSTYIIPCFATTA